MGADLERGLPLSEAARVRLVSCRSAAQVCLLARERGISPMQVASSSARTGEVTNLLRAARDGDAARWTASCRSSTRTSVGWPGGSSAADSARGRAADRAGARSVHKLYTGGATPGIAPTSSPSPLARCGRCSSTTRGVAPPRSAEAAGSTSTLGDQAGSRRRRRRHALARRRLNELEPRQRQVVDCRFFGGMEEQEIARRSASPSGQCAATG